jgi:hypothetical protein
MTADEKANKTTVLDGTFFDGQVGSFRPLSVSR